jgi:hypothetical protein
MRVILFGWQVMKSQIIEQLGQADILLPSLVGEGWPPMIVSRFA